MNLVICLFVQVPTFLFLHVHTGVTKDRWCDGLREGTLIVEIAYNYNRKPGILE